MNTTFRSRIRESLAGFNRGLWVLTGGQVIQLIGDHFVTIAISAFTYTMTRSAWSYALQQLAAFLPWMLFSSIAGPISDRFDRRKVLISADLIRATICFFYPFCRAIEALLMLNFLRSVAGVFAMNARVALVPRLCDRDRLLQANGIRTAVFGVIDLTGPALAGFLMGKIGTTVAFRFTATMWVIGALIFLSIPAFAGRPERQAAVAGPAPGFWRDLRAGLAFLRGDRALLGMVILYCVYTAGQNGTNSVFYPYVEDVLRAGPAVFGLSISFYFGANLLAGILLARFGRMFSRLPMIWLMVPASFVWFGYSLARHIPLVLAMGFLEGMIFSTLTNLFTTRVQSRAPSAMTGRVWGLASSITSGGEVLGILGSGAAAGRFGPVVAYRVVGTVGLALIILADLARRASARRSEADGSAPLAAE
ncbi:MAG: MFS transporter [Chloroflexota bacterium]